MENKPLKFDDARMLAHDQRTELVKDMVAAENAALDARTAKLRELRMAKDQMPEVGKRDPVAAK